MRTFRHCIKETPPRPHLPFTGHVLILYLSGNTLLERMLQLVAGDIGESPVVGQLCLCVSGNVSLSLSLP